MGFYEHNLGLIDQIRRDSQLKEHLLERNEHASTLERVGERGSRRVFCPVGRHVNGIPLGLKIGENNAIGIEAATIEYVYDNIQALRPLLPRVFGVLPSPDAINWATIVMEDFSSNGKWRVEASHTALPDLLSLGTYGVEAQKATFAITDGINEWFRMGDFDSLYTTLREDVRMRITEILVDKYDDIRVLSVV